MLLHYKQYSGQGAPLVILHGLYGNQGNWSLHARQLAGQYAVYAFDARNHGQSAHTDSMLLSEMAADVADTMRALGLDQAHLLGHSMGGKTAMLLALQQPQRVRSLTVVDIAPVDYHKPRDAVLSAMLGLDLAALQDRADADQQLALSIPEQAVRDFLLANLQRRAGGGFQWRLNLEVIARHFSEVTGWASSAAVYEGPVLFIRGERSDYILPEHQQETLRQFPNATLKTVSGAGHWVHAEKPEAVQRLIRNFLDAQP
jgi:esterase